MEAIQYWLAAFALTCWALAVVVHVGNRRLTVDLARSEAGGAADRPGTNAYFYAYLDSRTTISPAFAIVLGVGGTIAIGFGVVYMLAPNLLLVCLGLTEAFAVYLNMDSIEALLFERHLSRSPPGQVGRWELGFGRWAQGAMKRGSRAFAALGVAMALLIPYATQAVAGVEWGASFYIGGVYALAVDSPLGPGPSVMFMVLIYGATLIGGAWLVSKAAAIQRRRRRESTGR